MNVKQQLIILFLASSLSSIASYAAEESDQQAGNDNDFIVEESANSVFKGLMYKTWSKLKSFSPKTRVKGNRQTVATAGIRGSENTETLLKPYWKEDKTADPTFVASVEDFNQIQSLVDAGKLEQAASSLDSFIGKYRDSDLLPNALFAKALVLGGQGQGAAGVKILKKFVKNNPSHPLKEDAEVLMSELAKLQG